VRSQVGRIVWAVSLLLSLEGLAWAQWTWTPQTGRWVNPERLPKETPELQVEYTRSLMLQGDYKKAIRETEKFSDFYPDSDMGDENQFLRGEIRQKQGKHVEAAKEFQQVVTGYPESDLFQQVIGKQYEIGDALYEEGKAKLAKKWRLFRKRPFKRAIEVYSMVIENQPFTDTAAEAQYKVGLCHLTRKEYTEAAYEYRRVIEDYGNSDWVDEASYDLAMTYYKSSRPAEYDQGPTLLTINAIDDFKARYPTDTRVADLDATRAKMRSRIARQRLQTAEFYERRRLFKAARISYEVVVEQFADTPAAEQARRWLEQNPAAGVPATAGPEPKAS
jgi:outer membrane protein assembly factor BamD